MSRSRSRAAVRTVLGLCSDVARFLSAAGRSQAHLAAENLFLKKQLALCLERQLKPRRADHATRITLVALSRLVDWRQILIIVQPATLIRWHRTGFPFLWRWKTPPRGRPPVPADVQRLIVEMASMNRTWGEGRIAAELL